MQIIDFQEWDYNNHIKKTEKKKKEKKKKRKKNHAVNKTTLIQFMLWIFEKERNITCIITS